MNTRASPSKSEREKTENQESQKKHLLELVSRIRTNLNSLKSIESSSLLGEIAEKEMQLKALMPDGKDYSSSKLTSLDKDIERITRKAQEEFQRFSQAAEIDKLQKKLELLKGGKSISITRKVAEKEARLKALSPDISDFSSVELAALRNEIDEISRISQQETQKNSRLEEISGIKTKLASLKSTETAPFAAKIEEITRKLASLTLDGDERITVELNSLAKEISQIEEEIESTGRKPNRLRIFAWLGNVLSQKEIWVAAIPVAASIYLGYLGFVQSTSQLKYPIAVTQTAEAKQTNIVATPSHGDEATVSFNNPDTNQAPVQLIIKDGDHPNDNPVVKIIIEPGGTVPIKDLSPGNYQIEVRPIYSATTSISADCMIQWQQSTSYRGDLVITSGQTVFQIRQFDLEPQGICFTGTPVVSSSTPAK